MANETYWINRRTGARCEPHYLGWMLFNAYGYVGTYSTVREALEHYR